MRGGRERYGGAEERMFCKGRRGWWAEGGEEEGAGEVEESLEELEEKE